MSTDMLEGIAEAILGRIDARLQTSPRLLIAIDGRCAAGKTSLAARLMRKTGCNVLHMDQFFLRPEQRTAKRLDMPGGNVDYERFLQEALLPLCGEKAFSFRPYDCHKQTLASPVWIQPQAINIVEGSYSCHPTLWHHYDMRIFLSVNPNEQIRRIRKRNGERRAVRFQQEWIPLEEAYFAAYCIAGLCDFCYETG
ncbi:MAG: uridine kinase [Eubacteriales bacterium]|nr:uridine kinase [Eubacteriales bacterium]